MHVLNTFGLPIGEIVVVDQDEDVQKIREAGLPYVVRPGKMKDDAILKALLYPIIVNRFPWLKLSSKNHVELIAPVIVKVPGEESCREGGSEGESWCTEEAIGIEGITMYDSECYRYSLGGVPADEQIEDELALSYESVDLSKLEEQGYLTVDTAQLMDAGLLPKFLMDIGESIRANLTSYTWVDRWSRKLGAYLGEYEMVDERPNLIVLDISGSIPRGVAYTMVGLIDTLRQQANADLVVNSGSSQWWPHNEPIDIDQINKIIGGCNEARQFYRILEEHVLGRKWGNVIGFGDYDAPARKVDSSVIPDQSLFAKTEIGHAVGYHTQDIRMPGYLLWTRDCKTEEETLMGNSWVRGIRRC